MEDERPVAVEQAGELGDDFCRTSALVEGLRLWSRIFGIWTEMARGVRCFSGHHGSVLKHCRGLLTFRKLMWSIDIIAAHDDHRQLEAFGISIHEHLCSSLACSIWVRGG